MLLLTESIHLFLVLVVFFIKFIYVKQGRWKYRSEVSGEAEWDPLQEITWAPTDASSLGPHEWYLGGSETAPGSGDQWWHRLWKKYSGLFLNFSHQIFLQTIDQGQQNLRFCQVLLKYVYFLLHSLNYISKWMLFNASNWSCLYVLQNICSKMLFKLNVSDVIFMNAVTIFISVSKETFLLLRSFVVFLIYLLLNSVSYIYQDITSYWFPDSSVLARWLAFKLELS
jgi:hypothetical protein